MRDGIPVFGICEVNGKTLKSCYRLKTGSVGDVVEDYFFEEGDDCDLDKANGYIFPDGSYGYIFSENYPFIMPGYMGSTISPICAL